MSSADRLAVPLQDLSDREVEVLRLLASGHTVKTIASQLGRSEASINERLRDARRKTGVGSSRELARLLGAQKFWDRKIDLSAPAPAGDAGVRPAPGGPGMSKGKIMMFLAAPLALVGMALAAPAVLGTAAPQPAAAPRQAPFAGRWALDVDRMTGTDRPQRVTFEFTPLAGNRWHTIVQIVPAEGPAMQAESTAAVDGVAQPISGNVPAFDTVALRQPSPNTLVMTLGKSGAPVSTRVYTVSKDRRTMTETIVWAARDLPQLETTYFKRIG